MGPPTRRAVLHGTLAGASAIASSGCLSQAVPGLSNGNPRPEPFTNDTYAGSYTATGDWPMAGHDAGRTRHSDSPVPRGDVDIAWLRQPGEERRGTTAPVVGPERVYVASEGLVDGNGTGTTRLTGWDAESGERRLDVAVGTGYAYPPAVTGETLLAVTRNSELERATVTALDRNGGSTRWTETVPGLSGPPVVRDETCYLVTRGEQRAVAAYGLGGTRLWRTPLSEDPTAAPCTDGDGVYVGLRDNRIAALDAATGEPRWWERVVPLRTAPGIQGPPALADGTMYVSGATGELVAIDPADGSVSWRTSLVEAGDGSAEASPVITDEAAYVNAGDDGLVAVDLGDESIRWRSPATRDDGAPATGDGGVVVSPDDAVVAYDDRGDRAWTTEIPAPDYDRSYSVETSVVLAHGMCYVSTVDGRVYAIGSRS